MRFPCFLVPEVKDHVQMVILRLCIIASTQCKPWANALCILPSGAPCGVGVTSAGDAVDAIGVAFFIPGTGVVIMGKGQHI